MLWWDSCRLERGLPGPFPATLCVWRSLRFRSWPKAPTLLLLGDHLYTTAHPEGTSCVRQLLAAYTGTSVMALQRTAEAQLAPARFLPASSPPPRSLLGTFPAGTRAPVRLRDGQVGYLWQGEPSLPTSLQILATPRPHLGHTSAIPRPYLRQGELADAVWRRRRRRAAARAPDDAGGEADRRVRRDQPGGAGLARRDVPQRLWPLHHHRDGWPTPAARLHGRVSPMPWTCRGHVR